MTELELLKKEILFRGSRRGAKELDIALGEFVRARIDDLSEPDLRDLRDLLLQQEPDLLKWVVDEVPAPEAVNTPVFRQVIAFKKQRRGTAH